MQRTSWAFLSALSLTACAGDELNTVAEEQQKDPQEQERPSTCQTGGVSGHVCLPSGLPLHDALVYIDAIDCNGATDRYQAETGEDGEFAIAGIPEGDLELIIDHDDLYKTIPVSVRAGTILGVDRDADGELLCETPPPPRVAVITGSWDEVNVLLDELSMPYDIFNGDAGDGTSEAYDLLADFTRLSEYDAVFVNCGTMERDFLAGTPYFGSDYYLSIEFDYNAITYRNLRQFVENGGSVYASDWAWPAVEGLRADMINFFGDEGSDGYNVTRGVEEPINADVMHPGLASFLGGDEVALDFDLGGWAVIDTVAPAVDVYVQGDLDAYTSDYGSETTTLNDRALLVGFRPFVGGGYVIYTTFHYHAQPSAEMLDVLRYLIFQL